MIRILQPFTTSFVLMWPLLSTGQGTLQITFDGSPSQPPGSIYGVQSYYESGMYFYPSAPGTDQFGRAWTGLPTGWPDDGTPYIIAGQGDSLGFDFTDGSTFGLMSVDLAAFSSGIPNYTVNFIGYHPDGSSVTTSFLGSGIGFQTYNFGSDWSSGLSRVEIPNYGWSLDNLIVTVPEPSTGTLLLLGLLAFQFQRIKMIKRL